jgi:hypothetical protein
MHPIPLLINSGEKKRTPIAPQIVPNVPIGHTMRRKTDTKSVNGDQRKSKMERQLELYLILDSNADCLGLRGLLNGNGSLLTHGGDDGDH